MKSYIILAIFIISTSCCYGQSHKLSPFVRKAAESINQRNKIDIQSSTINLQSSTINHQPSTINHQPSLPTITAFVKANNDKSLLENGCRILAQWDDLYIASIPLYKINNLAKNPDIMRIEAGPHAEIHNDSCAIVSGVQQVWDGHNLPQAYTGKGVVVGIQDIGFDFTHPTFGNRIYRFWDMITPDTVGSHMFVGREYTSNEEITSLRHSYDGLQETHGTHTSGSAAGGGYKFEYSGMAPESDIVLVGNLCGDNVALVDSAEYYKYTNATDILGFKYIFDYAESQDKPCVISFSEGTTMDMYQGDLLYEALEKITGPGKIFVAAAGNDGLNSRYMQKTADMESAATYVSHPSKNQTGCFVTSDKYITITLDFCDTTIVIKSEQLVALPDSCYNDTIKSVPVSVYAYPSCYNQDMLVHEINIGNKSFNLKVEGDNAYAESYSFRGFFYGGNAESGLTVGDPAAAPAAICVGACGYRAGVYNYKDIWKESNVGTKGSRAIFSSRGPNVLGNTKPDILAPGSNIISSYNSFYLENHPDASDVDWDVRRFLHNGRTYEWNSNSGTSMSAPIAAGIIALWLQAKPTLTKEDIIDVFAHTAKHYDSSLSYPNNEYGYGEIDAYAGLLYILGVDGIVSPHQIGPSVFPLQDGETMTIYTTDGKRVERMESGNVYAIQIISPNPQRCGSMLIRK